LKERTAAKARRTMASGEARPLAPLPPGTLVVVLGAAEVLEDAEELVLDPVEAELVAELVPVAVVEPLLVPLLVAELPLELGAAELPEVADAAALEGEAVAPINWNSVP